jgi:hypothetical protein
MNFESITKMAKAPEKPKPPEKSQAELRAALAQRLNSLKPAMQDGMKEYQQALEDDVFEDQPNEAAGAGEARKEAMQNKLAAIFDRAEKIKAKLDSKKNLPQMQEEISAAYFRPDGQREIIDLSLEAKLADFLSFYQTTKIDLPPDFEDTVRDIWEKNQTEIEQAIEQNGFDDLLIIPPVADAGDLSEKMKMEKGYWTGSNFDDGGGFAGSKSENADKPRIILFHKKTLSKIQEENGIDVHLNITAGDAKKLFEQNPDEQMNLIDFLIMERKIFAESNIHISDYKEKSGQWLNTGALARLVYSYWNPDFGRLAVNANGPEYQYAHLGVRPARCFF